jgi:formate C-acetyltransferase
LAASADGRRAGEPVADSIGPSQGTDRNGPTAMLASAAKLPFGKATCGACLNLKLVPSLFSRPEGAANVADLFSTYFNLGGQQLQVNVVDRDTLIRAKERPEEYRSLVVRVGGYSDLFVNLSPEYQDDLIARTGHDLVS